MNRRYKRESYPLSQRVQFMDMFLEMARQDSAFLLAERQLDRAEPDYRQVLASLTPAERKALQAHYRAADSLADATAALAFFLGMTQGNRRRRLQSRRHRGKV